MLTVVSWAGLGVLLFSALSKAAKPLSDPDLWWHLRVGRELWGDWSIGQPGALSELATEQWTARDWLLQMVAASFESAWGLPGVAWLAGAGYVTCAVALWFACRSVADPLPSLVATAVGFYGMSLSLTSRPQLVSLVLLSVFVTAWLRTADDRRPRWYLLPLTGVWACCHGMWVTGVVVGAAVVVGLALQRRGDSRELARLLVIPVGGVVLAAMSPAGPGVVLAAVESSETREFIAEWQRTSFTSPAALAVVVALGTALLSWILRREVSWPRLALFGLAVIWTAMAMRTVALGAVISAPLMAGALQSWTQQRQGPRRRAEHSVVGALAAGTLAALALTVPATAQQPAGYPLRLSDRFEAMPAGTVVYNAYEVGGWLEWEHPHLVPAADGNTPGYSEGYLRRYVETLGMSGEWYDFVKATHADYALLEKPSPLAAGLASKGWVEVDEDSGYILLEAPSD